jgi:PAS domain S-box-containing protein
MNNRSRVLRRVRARPRIMLNDTARVHALGDVNGLSRQAIEALPGATYMTDAEGRITFYNEAAAELWGCRPELGESKFCGSWKLYWPDGTPLPHDECPMALALHQRRPIRGMEAVAERPDGTRIPFIPYPTPLFDDSGRLTGAVNMLVDITERKRAEELLKEREAQLAVFVEHAPVAIAMFDRDMRYLAVSRRFIRNYRLPPEAQLLGRSHYEIFPTIPQRLRDIHARVLAGEELSQEEDRFAHRDGRTDWVRWSMAPWHDAKGNVAGALLFAEITTEQVEARRALAQSEAHLAERNAQFDLAHKAAGVGSYTYDLPVKAMRISRASAANQDLSDSNVEITTPQWWARVHRDDVERLREEHISAFKQRRRELVNEFRFVLPGGKVRWIEARSLIDYGRTGRAERMTGVYIDVTERRKAEDAKSLLVAELDHRVKNVLACVAAVAKSSQECSRSPHEFIEVLNGRINALANTHALLSRSRWEGVSLRELVRNELAFCAKDGNAQIEGPEVSLAAEATQPVAMVLHELATNAAKYGALSKGHGRVSIRWRKASRGRSNGKLVFEWRETGGPPVAPSSTTGYGTSVICDLIPYELGGVVDYKLARDGAVCRLEIPAKWLSD